MNQTADVLEEHETTADTPVAASPVQRVLRRGRDAGSSAVKVSTLLTGVLVLALAATIGVLGWQVHDKSGELSDMHATATDHAHAEQIALDYATAAAEMNFQDLGTWKAHLTRGTSPELSDRLTQAATSMEQIIVPLQWVSTAEPIAAKVQSEENGVYSVDCFVSILTKNSQAPEGIQSTATYRLGIDSSNNWTISDIGGFGAALGGGAPR
ncbi:hypothetical protein [Nocardia shimofusensis]|uniref:hypothetical protein n=1 Tax=Nocardia shimofusensis TaxID=228596 RepID=UPI000AB668FB|nr:hypothetical protein [Nocardia shimofusensis]